MGLDVAVSVARGTPCLDTFPVRNSGNVLLYMAEDPASLVKARLLGFCRHRGLDLAALPIDVITAVSVRPDWLPDQHRLAETVRPQKPRLLLLDPVVRLHQVNENQAGEVAAILGDLRALQRAYNLAAIVVHHTRKNGSANEALGLDRPDVDLKLGILHIRRTKFGKSRYVPVHPSTISEPGSSDHRMDGAIYLRQAIPTNQPPHRSQGSRLRSTADGHASSIRHPDLDPLLCRTRCRTGTSQAVYLPGARPCDRYPLVLCAAAHNVVSAKRTPSCKESRRVAMWRHDQALPEGVDEVAKTGFRTRT
jgi:AAA domain